MAAAAVMRLRMISQHLLGRSQNFRPRSTIVPRSLSSAIDSDNGKAVMATRTQRNILDSSISYIDTGKGEEVVIFLHGNPTSAYLWRNIIPHVQPIARCIAPDLIGMGHSGKQPHNSYRFVDHFKYLSAWIQDMALPKKLHFLLHDWGSGLGFHWCNLNRDRVASISYLEALVAPIPSWDQFPDASRQVFQALRTDAGEDMVLKKNFFMKRLLPMAILRELKEEEMAEYLMPYMEGGESRRPTLTWPREIPVASDGPSDVVQFATDYNRWLSSAAEVPKLYIHVEPGFFSPGIFKSVQNWPNNRIVTVTGHHFAQEDSPNEIGEAVKNFIMSLKK